MSIKTTARIKCSPTVLAGVLVVSGTAVLLAAAALDESVKILLQNVYNKKVSVQLKMAGIAGDR